jgi:hypothetical protein
MPNELAEAITEFIWLIKTLMTRCSGAVAKAACLHVLSFAKHVSGWRRAGRIPAVLDRERAARRT